MKKLIALVSAKGKTIEEVLKEVNKALPLRRSPSLGHSPTAGVKSIENNKKVNL